MTLFHSRVSKLLPFMLFPIIPCKTCKTSAFKTPIGGLSQYTDHDYYCNNWATIRYQHVIHLVVLLQPSARRNASMMFWMTTWMHYKTLVI